MGGHCEIQFNSAGTTFTMRCPTTRPLESPWSAHRSLDDEAPAATAPEEREEAFEMPAGCWGICIDDSKIQHTLLAKLLGFAGITDF